MTGMMRKNISGSRATRLRETSPQTKVQTEKLLRQIALITEVIAELALPEKMGKGFKLPKGSGHVNKKSSAARAKAGIAQDPSYDQFRWPSTGIHPRSRKATDRSPPSEMKNITPIKRPRLQ